MKNFKSFRSAVIPFAPGFTAIMGPNGSGKSNIIDALIFVLGEGRLKLVRASRLKDLVNVKAKDGEAIVSLDIEADGKTYTITRTINRKGQSVYRLNGKRTTRHEIITLLSSLGISQRGYNFVLQGEITRLIKMGPVERRQVIDEIAGIAEYEEKKEEAMKKLDDVSQRIKEVSIVLGEREEQLERLRKEKEDAERYLELKSYVTSLRKGLLLREIRRNEERLKELSEELSRKKEEIENLKNKREELEEELRRLEERSQELTSEISRLYSLGGEGAYESLLREKEGKQKEIEHLRMRKNEAESEILVLQEELEKLEKEIITLRSEIDGVGGRRREKDTEVNELRQKIRSLEEVIKKEQDEALAIQRRIEELEERIKNLKDEYSRLREEYGKLLGEYNAKLEAQRKKKEKLERMLAEREKAKKELESLDLEIREIERKKKELQEEERNLNKEYMLLQEEIKELREEIGALRGASMALRNLGISTEVLNALLEAQRRGELRGIKGFVASLISYEKRYRRALEAAAGRRLFYIVVETANDAAEAIKYLKRNGLGRATFIPLDRIRPHVVDVPRMSGVIGRALDLVSFDPTLKRAMEYVFGDTLVVENIDVAKELDGYRSVTLDGDVVERSGVMSGGSVRGESLLKLFEAEKKKTELREKELRIKEIVGRLSQIRKELERVNRRLSELLTKKERLKAKLEEFSIEEEEEHLEDLKKRMEELQERMTMITNEISDLELERSKLVSQAKKSGSELLNQLNALRREYEAKLNELHEYDILLKEKKTRLQSLLDEKERKEKRIESLREEIKDLEAREEVLLQEIQELSQKIAKIEEEMKKHKEEVERLIREKEEVDKKIRMVSQEIGKINTALSSLERDTAVLEREIGMIKARIEELKAEYNEIEGEPLEPLPPDPEKTLKEKMEEMRSLEPVNLKAIEDYEKLREKVEEVKERVKKLEEERKAVLDMISEIEKKKKEVFMETFRGLARKFEEVYADLVGGKGRLRLTNEKDVFNAGLIIEVTPKGKGPRNIDALSGGEKAMVALAFIFATALFRPAPFYVLDEPDLMLDKLNAERMAKYIKKLSRTSQFIVVSHRDVVVKEADQIIGVYLGRDGSSVVEVRVPQASQASS